MRTKRAKSEPAGGEEKLGSLRGLIAIAGNAKIGVYASSGAFYIFLALFPTAALLCSLLPLLPFTQEALLEWLSAVLPDFMRSLLSDIIGGMYAYSAAAFSISVVLLVWSAGKAFIGLMRGLNRIYCGEDRSSLRLRGLSCLYMLAFLVSMLLTLGLSLFQRTLLENIALRWPSSAAVVGALLKLRFLPGMLLLVLYFSLLYTVIPAGNRRFSEQLPGALMASALWMLLSWGFSRYLNLVGAASVYGSLATVAMALMWIYWCISLTLLGGCLNVWLSGRRSEETKKAKNDK